MKKSLKIYSAIALAGLGFLQLYRRNTTPGQHCYV